MAQSPFGNFQPFYDKKPSTINSFIEEDEYYKSLLPEGWKFWTSDDIGLLFFGASNYLSNTIQIYNESKFLKITAHTITAEEEELIKAKIENDHVLSDILVNGGPISKNPIQYKIFISDDGAKLTYLANNSTNGLPKDNEILVFIEGDDDLISGKKLIIRVGNGIKLGNTFIKDILKGTTTVSDKDIDTLLSTLVDEKNNILEEFILEKLFVVTKKAKEFLYSFFKGFDPIYDLLEKLKVQKKIWSPVKNKVEYNFLDSIKEFEGDLDATKVSLNKIKSGLLEKLEKMKVPLAKTISGIFNIVLDVVEALAYIIVKIADFFATLLNLMVSVLAGIINGVIDLIIGLLWMVETSIKISLGIRLALPGAAKYMTNIERQLFVEQVDNFLASVSTLKFINVLSKWFDESCLFINSINFNNIINSIKDETKELAEQVISPNKLFGNLFEVAYYIGYLLTFFIPIGGFIEFLRVAGGIGGRVLVGFFEVIEHIIGKLFNIAGRFAKNSFVFIRDLIRAVTDKLKESKGIENIIEEFFRAVTQWLDQIAPKWRELTAILTSFGLLSFTVIDGGALVNILLLGGFTGSAALIKKIIKVSAIQFGKVSKDGIEFFAILYKEITIFTGQAETLDEFIQKVSKEKNVQNYLDDLVIKIENLKKWPKIKNKFPTSRIPEEGFITKFKFDSKGFLRDLEGGLLRKDDYNFVILESGELILGFKHQLLSNAGDVLAAGEIVIRKGRIVLITNRSGHFRPTVDESLLFQKLFKEIGLPVSGANLKIYKFIQTGNGYPDEVFFKKIRL